MGEHRIFNFSAGPSMLPLSVLKKAASEMTDYRGSGMSVMEMSHRSPVYDEIIVGTGALLRSVMGIPENYKILFLQGGATLQFSMVPINLMNKNRTADYVVTGHFSEKAYEEALKYGSARLAASSADKNHSYIPRQQGLSLNPDADYVYICSNNTIFGTAWDYIPETAGVPLVSDMSSCILSEPCDVSKYGLIFAGAQKNMGPAGLTVVIVREDLLGVCPDFTPTMLSYKVMAKHDSMYNTPPTYSVYMLKLVLEWIVSIGGLFELGAINRRKAALLYDYLDGSSLFIPAASKRDRSLMNVTFRTSDAALDLDFVKGAEAIGLSNLKGHRAVGGMRASIYNAMPEDGIVKLVDYMSSFEAKNK